MDDVRFSLGRGLVYPRRAGVELAPTGVGMRGTRDAWSLRGLGGFLETMQAGALAIWSDVLQYAPLPDNVSTVRDAWLILQRAEDQCIDTANAYIRAHNQGRLVAHDYADYDGMRHDIHDRQVGFHNACRQTCYEVLGRSAGDQVIARVPWPGWFPALRPGMGMVAEVSRGSLGVAPIVIAAVAIVAVGAIALLVHEISNYRHEATAAFVAQARAHALELSMQQRERIYNQCIQAGGTATACAQSSVAVTGDLVSAIDKIRGDYGEQTRQRWLRIALPVGAGALLVAGLAIFFKVRRNRRKRAAALPARS